jgi:GNAT superfamily N-acetyltransferase
MIRSLQPRDKTPVLDIIRATGMFTPAEVTVAEDLIDIYLGRPEQKDYDVVVMEGETGNIAGYMTWGPTPLTEGAYDIYWMAVAPSEQGKGLGTGLVRWVEGEVRGRGGRLIVIETSSQPKYEPTRQFYINLDYREVARVPEFYRPGDDRIIYAKYLR